MVVNRPLLTPLLVLVLTSIPIIALVWLGFTPGVLGAGLFIACYTVGAWSSNRLLAVAVVFTSGMLVVVGLLWPQHVNPMQLMDTFKVCVRNGRRCGSSPRRARVRPTRCWPPCWK